MGKQNNIITREILILATWFTEQKVILFRCRTDIPDELARPEPARLDPAMTLTAYFSNMLRDTNLKPSRNRVIDIKIVLLYLHRDFSNSSEVIAFFTKTEFCHFYLSFCV